MKENNFIMNQMAVHVIWESINKYKEDMIRNVFYPDDYPFELSFHELLLEVDNIFEQEGNWEQFVEKIEKQFGENFLSIYENYLSNVFYKAKNIFVEIKKDKKSINPEIEVPDFANEIQELQDIQKKAYKILDYSNASNERITTKIFKNYPFDISFDELLAELDLLFDNNDYEDILRSVNEKFGEDFLEKYIEYVNSVLKVYKRYR